MKNEVIIIGGNHHNTLSVMRCFGKKNINYKVLIHGNNKNSHNMMINYSKYSKNIFVVENNEISILNWLLKNKSSQKQVIIPCSDLAEYSIDNNYSKLIDYYYIPGFKNKPGKVCKLMNKYAQKKFAEKYDILMAKSWLIRISEKLKLPSDMIYPCIVKPNISAKGFKGDIKICYNKKNLMDCLENTYKDYESVIIQQFLNKKYELLAMGYISDKGYDAGAVERKIRETIPGGGGSTALGKFINEENVNDSVNKVLKLLYQQGYRGLYDIEFFECDDGIYLNEINFRHSGSGFALIDNGINAPYLCYLDFINKVHSDKHVLKYKNGYFFCDIGEVDLLIKYKLINIFQFVCDFFKSYSHSIFSLKDLGVTKYYIFNRRSNESKTRK